MVAIDTLEKKPPSKFVLYDLLTVTLIHSFYGLTETILFVGTLRLITLNSNE